MPSHEVHILIGSLSDEKYLKESKAVQILRQANIPIRATAISAHRNLRELSQYVHSSTVPGEVYICGAGWAAALPGTVKALLLGGSGVEAVPVLGVALPSEAYPSAEDAEISILRLPPGVDVEFAGVGSDGFTVAAIAALEYFKSFNYKTFDEKCAALAAKLAEKKPQELDLTDY